MDWLAAPDPVLSPEDVRERLKEFYRCTVETLEDEEDLGSCLKDLLLDGFDVEQLWSQLEPLNRVLNTSLKHRLNELGSEFELLTNEMQLEIEEALEPKRNTPNTELDESLESQRPDAELDESLESQRPDAELDENAFLKFDEMREFVEEAEMDDEDDDLLGSQDIDEEEEEEETESQDLPPGHEIMYKDFFHSSLHDTRSTDQKLVDSNQSMSKTEKQREELELEIDRLEEEAIGEKDWPFRGEIKASDRPMNSALEVDLDYETTVKPAPKPTQAHLDSLENLIKTRIKELKFDDVERVIPPPLEETKKLIELDDSKPKKGLGEIYEEAYVEKTWGVNTLEEKEERLRIEARKLFKETSLQLDALTHFHFAPRPIVEDDKIKTNAPAIVMEDSVPLAVSAASLQTPVEVYNPVSKTGEWTESKELTKDDRKRMRAKRKRAAKKTGAEQVSGRIAGRQSLVSRQQEAGEKRRKLLIKDKSSFTSTAVFRNLQASVETRNSQKLNSTKTSKSSLEKI
eukprot:g2572.t1